MPQKKTLKNKRLKSLKKTRKIKSKKMSNTAQNILNEYKSDPKIKIHKVITGIEAFNTAKEMMFPNDLEEGKKWAQTIPQSKKENAFVFIYSRKLRKNLEIVLKLIMGSGDDGSVLGQKWKAEEAIKILPKEIISKL
jgi:hypothetical protein